MNVSEATVMINEIIVKLIRIISKGNNIIRGVNLPIVNYYGKKEKNCFVVDLGGGLLIRIDYDGFLESKHELVFRTYVHNYLLPPQRQHIYNIGIEDFELNKYELDSYFSKDEISEYYDKIIEKSKKMFSENNENINNENKNNEIIEINPYINTSRIGENGVKKDRCIIYGGGNVSKLSQFLKDYYNKTVDSKDLINELYAMNGFLDSNKFGIKFGDNINKADTYNLQEIISLKRKISNELFSLRDKVIVNAGLMITIRLNFDYKPCEHLFRNYIEVLRVYDEQVGRMHGIGRYDDMVSNQPEKFDIHILRIIERVCDIVKSLFK